MVLALTFSAIFLLPVVTVFLPRLLLLPWLLALLLASMWLWQQLEGVDGPAGFFAFALVAFFTLTNWFVAFVRLVFVLTWMFLAYGEQIRPD